MTIALVCKKCAGSLPPPRGGSVFVTCPYCGTTHTVDAPKMSLPPQVQGPSEYELRQVAAKAAWDEARATSADPVVALRAVVSVCSSGLRDEVEAERAARLGEALLAGFDTANKSQAMLNRDAVVRVGNEVVKAVIELRKSADTSINLPFLLSAQSGPPLHLSRDVTQAELAALDAMGVYEVKEAAAPPPAAEPAAAPTKAARRWWPFGG